jgi:hypothetical protein
MNQGFLVVKPSFVKPYGPFLLAISLSVLRFTDLIDLFGIFKLIHLTTANGTYPLSSVTDIR